MGVIPFIVATAAQRYTFSTVLPLNHHSNGQVYHMGCYVPPLPGEPADDWVCLLCSSIDEILSVSHQPKSRGDFSSPAAYQNKEGSGKPLRAGSEALSSSSAGNVPALARISSLQV